jgi:NAD(P)-dependent dehydrogenase (short-subunit alcohol dehydrogenase family)
MTEKIALITGASRGLGAALAETLSANHHIVAIARTTGALEALDDRIQTTGGSATLAPVDITNQDALAQICRSIFDRWGHVDLWCHTAVHAAPLGPAATLDSKDWSKSIATNLTATGILIPFIAPLLGQEGRAVFFDDPHMGRPKQRKLHWHAVGPKNKKLQGRALILLHLIQCQPQPGHGFILANLESVLLIRSAKQNAFSQSSILFKPSGPTAIG